MITNQALREMLDDIQSKKIEECEWWERRRAAIVNELLQEFDEETVASMKKCVVKHGIAKSKKKKGRGNNTKVRVWTE